MMKNIKGYLDADEMMEMIQDTWFIEDLVQSQKTEKDDEDENILDIFLMMYPKMDNKKWSLLFTGLKLVLQEYLAYMFDDNVKLVNQAYQIILHRMYGYSLVGKKEIERQKYAETGQPLPAELEFKSAEKKLRAHVLELVKEKYLG